MNKKQLYTLIKECFTEVKCENKVKNAIKSLVIETLDEMGKRGRPRKEDAIPMDVQIRNVFTGKDFEGNVRPKNVVYTNELKGDTMLQDRIATELGYKSIPTLDAYVSSGLYNKLKTLFSKPEVSFREVLSIIRDIDNEFDTVNEEEMEVSDKLATEFMGNFKPDFQRKVYVKRKIGGTTTKGIDAADPVDDSPFGIDEPSFAEDVPQSHELGHLKIPNKDNDENDMSESKINRLKRLIKEEIEEIKKEKKDSLVEMIEELDEEVKKVNKEAGINQDDFGDYILDACPPHNMRIRHQFGDIFDVTYFKDEADREKKIGMKFDEVKKYIGEKLKFKDGNYVDKAYNKSAENSEDETKKVDGAIVNKTGIVVKKELKDTKKEDKDYIEQQVKNEDDMPDKPMKEVEKIKKQSDHSVKGTKPDYTQPKDVNKKHVVKGKAANRRFKGLPKGNKKD